MLLGRIFPQVEQAVTVLLKYVNTKEGKKLKTFINEHHNILLILALKKIRLKEKKPKKMLSDD